MKRFVPFFVLTLLFLLTLLRASASWAAPACLEGPGWRKLSAVEGQFLTHISDAFDTEKPGSPGHRPPRRHRRPQPHASAPPKHEGLDPVSLWELPNSGPVAEPERKLTIVLEGDQGECLVVRQAKSGVSKIEISVVPLSRDTDALQVKTSFVQGSVQQTTQLFDVDGKNKVFRELWSAITGQIDPNTGKLQISKIEYTDFNADNHTDIALTEPGAKSTLWKWNVGKRGFEITK